jgi:biopolymer transport protein ExbD
MATEFDFARIPRKRVNISLVPMIDVSVFLLIFFMLSGAVDKFEVIPVDPPVAKSGKLMDEGHMVVLVGRHDEIIIDDEMLDMKQIQNKLNASLQANPNKVITVKADAAVSANRVIDIMDAIKMAGGTNVSIETQSRAPIYVK